MDLVKKILQVAEELTKMMEDPMEGMRDVEKSLNLRKKAVLKVETRSRSDCRWQENSGEDGRTPHEGARADRNGSMTLHKNLKTAEEELDKILNAPEMEETPMDEATKNWRDRSSR